MPTFGTFYLCERSREGGPQPPFSGTGPKGYALGPVPDRVNSVYRSYLNSAKGKYHIVRAFGKNSIVFGEYDKEFGPYKSLFLGNYGKIWLAYRRKPEEGEFAKGCGKMVRMDGALTAKGTTSAALGVPSGMAACLSRKN